MSFRKLLFVTICVSLLSLADAPAFAESDSWTKDDVYSFMDGSRPIKSSELNGNSTEITFNQAGVQTPCKVKPIPADTTRHVRVEPFLCRF